MPLPHGKTADDNDRLHSMADDILQMDLKKKSIEPIITSYPASLNL